MFANMRANTPWNLNGDLRWGYYFTAFEKPSLEWSATVLSAQGYSVVDISRVEPPRGSKQEIWRLHVERVEHHTPESLSVRNEEFYAFAEKHGLASYDGMDVGPAK
jgi:hypothetical protein